MSSFLKLKKNFYSRSLLVISFKYSSVFMTCTEWALKQAQYDRNCMCTSLLLKTLNTSFWGLENQKDKILISLSGVFRRSHISFILLYYLTVRKKWYLMKWDPVWTFPERDQVRYEWSNQRQWVVLFKRVDSWSEGLVWNPAPPLFIAKWHWASHLFSPWCRFPTW